MPDPLPRMQTPDITFGIRLNEVAHAIRATFRDETGETLAQEQEALNCRIIAALKAKRASE